LSRNQQKILPSKSTPEVIFDPKGTIKFTGRLIPENAEAFFNQVEQLINEYFSNPVEFTSVEISLNYINSTGTKYLLEIIRKITHVHLRKNTKKFIINWYYIDEDEDILEKGKLFSFNLDVPFHFIRLS
jgi:hypothetical protein